MPVDTAVDAGRHRGREMMWPVPIARVALFDDPPALQQDDDRRSDSLRELVSAQPGFIAGYHLRDPATGRLMSMTVWETEEQLARAEGTVAARPIEDRRGIVPDRVERWVVEGVF